MIDVVVAGGGPAGLNAALMLGRAQRETLVCDTGTPRNQPVAAMHGFLSRDGFDPAELRRVGRQQLAQYRTVSTVVVVCTNGTCDLDDATRELLAGREIKIREELVTQIEGTGNDLERITFADGPTLSRRAMFFHAPTRPRSQLASQLGCTFLDDGSVQVDDLGDTDVTGVFAAGDMARRPTMPVPGEQVAIAAAEGLIAAVAIDQELFFESLA